MVMHKSSTSLNRTQVSKSGAQSDVSICQIPVADWPRLAGSFCPGSGPSPAQAWQNQCLQEGEGGVLQGQRRHVDSFPDLGTRLGSS